MANITPDPALVPGPTRPSQIEFILKYHRDGARDIITEPVRAKKLYVEVIEPRLKAEAEDERQSQEQVDGLAESTPVDLADYPQREV